VSSVRSSLSHATALPPVSCYFIFLRYFLHHRTMRDLTQNGVAEETSRMRYYDVSSGKQLQLTSRHSLTSQNTWNHNAISLSQPAWFPFLIHTQSDNGVGNLMCFQVSWAVAHHPANVLSYVAISFHKYKWRTFSTNCCEIVTFTYHCTALRTFFGHLFYWRSRLSRNT